LKRAVKTTSRVPWISVVVIIACYDFPDAF